MNESDRAYYRAVALEKLKTMEVVYEARKIGTEAVVIYKNFRAIGIVPRGKVFYEVIQRLLRTTPNCVFRGSIFGFD